MCLVITQPDGSRATQAKRGEAASGKHPNTSAFARVSFSGQHVSLALPAGGRVRDVGDWIEVVSSSDASFGNALVSFVIGTKQWLKVELRGPESMRRAAWHSLSAAGVQVFGYEPSLDEAEQLRRAESNASAFDPALQIPSADYLPESPTP
jgi:hypothetical protein